MTVHHAITLLIDDKDVGVLDAIVIAELRQSRETLEDFLGSDKDAEIYKALGLVIDYFTGDSDGRGNGHNNDQN